MNAMIWIYHIFVASLIVLFPIWDRHETRVLKASPDPRVRTRSYIKTILWQVVACAIILAGTPWQTIFHAPGSASGIASKIGNAGWGIAVGVLAGALLPAVLAAAKPDVRAGQIERLQSVSFFLPRGGRERMLFAVMCIAVGICEEIIFRGFLIRYFTAAPWHFGVIAAAAIAAIIFGIDHGYQGFTGILATTVLAIMFTVLFVATGSLLVPMIVHTLIDLRILLILPAGWSGFAVAGEAGSVDGGRGGM
jgi:membrane protease YdiL (CAAX protease family)